MRIKPHFLLLQLHNMKKRISPEITTLSICPDCGASTRASYHLDIDCEHIQKLKKQLESSVKLINTARPYLKHTIDDKLIDDFLKQYYSTE